MQKISLVLLLGIGILSCNHAAPASQEHISNKKIEKTENSNPIIGVWESKEANSRMIIEHNNIGQEDNLEGTVQNAFQWSINYPCLI